MKGKYFHMGTRETVVKVPHLHPCDLPKEWARRQSSTELESVGWEDDRQSDRLIQGQRDHSIK